MIIGVFAFLISGCDWVASHPSNPSNAHLSEEDRLLKFKFRGIYGGDKVISSHDEDLGPGALYLPNGGLFNLTGGPGPITSISSYGGSGKGDNLVVPKSLRYVRFDKESRIKGDSRFPHQTLIDPAINPVPLR